MMYVPLMLELARCLETHVVVSMKARGRLGKLNNQRLDVIIMSLRRLLRPPLIGPSFFFLFAPFGSPS